MRKEGSYFNAHIGMNPAEQKLAKGISENLFNKFISMVARAQAITMADLEFFALQGYLNGVFINFYTQLALQVTEHPKVVISGKDVHGYTSVC